MNPEWYVAEPAVSCHGYRPMVVTVANMQTESSPPDPNIFRVAATE